MTDTDGYREHAGTAHWPRTPDDLTRTDRCPACFSALATAVCRTCGLDLTHPAARELLDASTAAAHDLDRRLDLIGRIRFETAAHRVGAAVAERRARQERNAMADAAARVAARQDTATLPASSVASPPRAAPPPSVPDTTRSAPPTDSPPPPARRSGVQLVLLIVGVSLLSVGAIAFLVYAFVNYGIVWRSVIIGVVTVAAFAVATVLQRRSLRATAEGIAAFAVVLVYLDAYAIRANDLLGAASTNGAVYWGVALAAASVGFIGWHRAAGLRVPSIAGFLGFAPGIGLLVAGLTRQLDDAESTYLAFAAIALGGVIHRLAGRVTTTTVARHAGGIERALVLAASVTALALAALTAAVVQLGRPDPDATTPVLALLAVATIATIHIGVLRSLPVRTAHSSRWSSAFAVILGLALSTVGFAIVGNGGFAGGLLADNWPATPAVVAVAAALGFESMSLRASDAFLRSSARPAAWSAAVVGAIALLIPLIISASTIADTLTRSLRLAWSTPFDGRIATALPELEPVSALAIVVILAALAWWATGILRRRIGAIWWSSATVLLLVVPVLDVVWVMLAAWFALSAAALIGLVAIRTRTSGPMVRSLRPPAIGLLAASTVAGWTVGWSSTATWAIAAALSIGITLSARSLTRSTPARAALLGTASILLVIAAGAAARQITVSTGRDVWTDDPVRFAGVAAVILLLAAALVTTRLVTSTDRRTVFWITAPVAIGCTLWVRFSEYPAPVVLTDPVTALIVDVLLLVAVLAWAVPAATRTAVTPTAVTAAFPVERRAASVAIAPVVWITADSIAVAYWHTAQSEAIARSVAPAVAALIVATVSLAIARRHTASASATSRDAGNASRPATPRNLREIGVAAVTLAGIAGALATDSTATWLVLVLAAATLVVVSIGQPNEPVSAALIGSATLLAIGAAAASEWVSPATLDDARLAQVAAILLLTVSALPLGAVAGRLDRCTVFWLSLGAVVTTEASLRYAGVPSLLFSAPTSALIVHVVLLGALLLWMALRSSAAFRPERIAASIALGPAVYLVVESFVDVIDAPDFARSVAPMTAALLTAAGSLTVALLRPRSAVRRPFREIGVVLVGAPALAGALIADDPFGWLVLILAAITALLTAISADGLFASRSNRRQIGWLAIGLATAGLWLRLADDSTSAVEPYVLPVAGLLLLVALLTWRAAGVRTPAPAGELGVGEQGSDETAANETEAKRGAPRGSSEQTGRVSIASPLILLAGLLTAILPIAAYSATGDPLRAILIGAASALLLLVGSFVGSPARRTADPKSTRPYLDALALAGAVGMLVTAIGRSAVLLTERPSSIELDAWILGGMAVLVIAAFGIASIPDDAFLRQRRIAGQALAIFAVTSVGAIEVIAIVRVDAGIARPLGVVLLLAAVHLLAFLVDRPPFTRSVAWLSVGYALVVAVAGIVVGALDPLEAGSVPLALALIATGTVHLERTPAARSWPWLGPGVGLLLVPSLVATIDDRPLWRLVGIGVVGVAIVVIGAVRRFQAPFLIASVVLLIHAIATFAPQIRATYESVAWWLWLVIGGIILIVLAARYEQRLKNLRDIVERIGSLR